MNRIKRKFSNWLLSYLFRAVTEDDFLKWNGKTLTLNGQPLSPQRIQELKSSAETMRDMELWKLLANDITHTAQFNIYNKSQTLDDIIFPKAVLYVVDVLQKKLENLSNIEV